MSTWSGLNVEVTHDVHADSREVINRGLSDFNAERLGDHKWMALDVYVRDSDGRVVAGLIGGFVFDRLYVYALWISETLRGLGIGTRILKAAEATALERGCRVAFSAPGKSP